MMNIELRDYFAGLAMQEYLCAALNPNLQSAATTKEVAFYSYLAEDEMLKARDIKNES